MSNGLMSCKQLPICRVLDKGGECRTRVDTAIQQFHSVSEQGARMMDLIDCILACKQQLAELADSAESSDVDQARAAARRLGQRYLMRYVLLICFSGYLGSARIDADESIEARSGFKEWFDERKELSYLLQHCSV